jgi:hypothetical protein
MMGVGAGLVLLSLYSGRKAGKDGREEFLETAPPPERMEEEAEEAAKPKSGPFSSIALGLSVLALGAAMSGVIPGVNSEKVDELKTDLFAKAIETGEDFIKGTEKMLREKLSP